MAKKLTLRFTILTSNCCIKIQLHLVLNYGQKVSEMKIIVAKAGKFLETLQSHSCGSDAVVPYGAKWGVISESAHVFEALMTHPIERQPTHFQESSET